MQEHGAKRNRKTTKTRVSDESGFEGVVEDEVESEMEVLDVELSGSILGVEIQHTAVA